MSLWDTYGNPKISLKTISTISTISSILRVGGNIVDIVDIVDIPLSLKNAGYPYKRLCPYPGIGSVLTACEWWPPPERAEFERAYKLPTDLRGMGIDAGALPEVLAGFSITGWRLELTASGQIEMIPVAHDARNEDGNRDYLRVMQDRIRDCLECLTQLRPFSCSRKRSHEDHH